MSKNNTSLPSHVVRKQSRDLEEQRMKGLAPLAVDAVTGSSISPNVPSMLTTAPWYRRDLQTGNNDENKTVAHHSEGSDLAGAKDTVFQDPTPSLQYDRIDNKLTSSSKLLPKHAPGACRNCGATTHKTEACLRPKRKVGSAVSGSNEGTTHAVRGSANGAGTSLTYEQKKDAWNRSTTRNYQDTWDEHEKRIREREEQERTSAKAAPRTETNDIFSARTAAGGLKVSTQDLSSVPKYLENLSDDTFYDPRTKSMRGNPNALKKIDPAAATTVYKGDNAVLHTEGYFDYMDQQAKYLAGENKAFVELEDEAIEKERVTATKASMLAERLLKLSDSPEKRPNTLPDTPAPDGDDDEYIPM